MSRIVALLLEAGLIVSAIGAILYSLRIIMGSIIDVSWYWGGAMAAFAGPVAFALALFIHEKRDGARSKGTRQ